VLIDGGQPTSAPLVRANVEALGFRMADVKLLLNSHAHVDHAGGIAELQAASGAGAAAHPWAARVFRTGRAAPDDPQHGALPDFPAVRRVRALADGEVVRVGPLALTAHFTPGHTPGGTSWSWTSCEGGTCREVVYADSQTPVSAPGFSFTRSTRYPTALADFARSHAKLEGLRCEILITPHPDASSFWQRVEGAPGGGGPTLVDARRVPAPRGAVARAARRARGAGAEGGAVSAAGVRASRDDGAPPARHGRAAGRAVRAVHRGHGAAGARQPDPADVPGRLRRPHRGGRAARAGAGGGDARRAWGGAAEAGARARGRRRRRPARLRRGVVGRARSEGAAARDARPAGGPSG
jgi:metallo-beta-lactamase class B